MPRSDRDIERLLEDWLDAEARPIPQHVIESSLEAVTRTTQTRLGSDSDRQRLAMRFALVVAAASLAVIVIVAAPTVLRNLIGGPPPPAASPSVGTSATPTSAGMTWDLVLTFRELNPAPDGYGHTTVFSYMRGSTGGAGPSSYVPLPEFTAAEVSRWHDPAFPGVYVACCDTTPGLQLHPSGGGSNAVTAVVAWRNPVGPIPLEIRGSVEVDGSCGDGIVFSVLHGAEIWEQVDVREGRHPFSISVSRLDQGQVLYFAVGPGADSGCDTTWVNAVIESR